MVTEHYGTRPLVARLEEALHALGRADPLPRDVLAPLDQFHLRGAAATSELAARLSIRPGDRVLDVGCGLGGPARHVAAQFHCHVTGIDLNRQFIDAAAMLTRRTGLAECVDFVQGDALALPFNSACFDQAMTQHVAMNIEDKLAFYAGIRRVVKSGGRFGIYDVVAGEVGPLHFPVPWARSAATSFLVAAESLQVSLQAAGFSIVECADRTDAAISWIQGLTDAPSRDSPPRLALQLVMGPEFPVMAANLGRNLIERRVRLVQVIALKAPPPAGGGVVADTQVE